MRKRPAKLLLAGLVAALAAGIVLVGCAKQAQEQIQSKPVEVPQFDLVNKAVAEARRLAELQAAHEAELLEPFYALILGGDTRVNTLDGDQVDDGNYSRGYSDVMILARVNPGNGHMTLVSLPRDTAADYNGKPGKINDFMQFDGAEAAVAYVEEAAGVDISYYFATDFARYVKLIDGVGGIDVEVPITLTCGDPIAHSKIVLDPGWQHLDGASALVYSRTRKVYGDETDACRQIQDRNVIRTLVEKAAGGSEDELAVFLSALSSNIDTNLPAEDLQFYARHFFEIRDQLSFASGTMPYSGDIDPETEMWVVPFEPDTWAAMIQIMEDEGDPTALVALPEIWEAY